MTQNQSVAKGFARYAIPSVIGMVVSSLYNIVDGIFVGRGIGQLALGAINIVYPFIMLEIALSMLIAIGGANHFSANRGRGNSKEANQFFLQSMSCLMTIGVVINGLTLLFTPAVCRLLGADDALLPFAQEYIAWIALFGIINMPGLGLSIFVRNDDAPQLELLATLSGTVINIVLDYLFIMVMGKGMAGAAVATGIGQTISLFLLLCHFFKKRRVLHFARVECHLQNVKRIVTSGMPSFLMEFSQSAVAFSFNLVLMVWVGAEGISYYGIVMYICSMFNMVLIGLTQGAQPLMSFKHGSGKLAEVKAVRSLAIKTALISTTVIYIVVFFFGETLASAFVPDHSSLTALAANMMKYYFLAFFPIGVTLMNILYFQVTEQSGRAIILSFLRCIGFIQLFQLVLPSLLGVTGIYFSFLCGELCHCLLSAVFMRRDRYAAKMVSSSP